MGLTNFRDMIVTYKPDISNMTGNCQNMIVTVEKRSLLSKMPVTVWWHGVIAQVGTLQFGISFWNCGTWGQLIDLTLGFK